MLGSWKLKLQNEGASALPREQNNKARHTPISVKQKWLARRVISVKQKCRLPLQPNYHVLQIVVDTGRTRLLRPCHRPIIVIPCRLAVLVNQDLTQINVPLHSDKHAVTLEKRQTECCSGESQHTFHRFVSFVLNWEMKELPVKGPTHFQPTPVFHREMPRDRRFNANRIHRGSGVQIVSLQHTSLRDWRSMQMPPRGCAGSIIQCLYVSNRYVLCDVRCRCPTRPEGGCVKNPEKGDGRLVGSCGRRVTPGHCIDMLCLRKCARFYLSGTSSRCLPATFSASQRPNVNISILPCAVPREDGSASKKFSRISLARRCAYSSRSIASWSSRPARSLCVRFASYLFASVSKAPSVKGVMGSSASTVDASLWVPDDMALNCCVCKAEFTIYRRRHHCRCVGVCSKRDRASFCMPFPMMCR